MFQFWFSKSIFQFMVSFTDLELIYVKTVFHKPSSSLASKDLKNYMH